MTVQAGGTDLRERNGFAEAPPDFSPAQSGGVSSGVILCVMTYTDTSTATSALRLRPTSERALRQLRLVWLLGWRTPDIAAWLGVAPSTVRRRLRVHGLRGPSLPGEQYRPGG